MSRKKSNKISYDFPQSVRKKIVERDEDQCLFCRMDYHMECRSEVLYRLRNIMHFVNKSQGGLGVEENGVVGCQYHHGLLDNGHLGLRDEMLEIMETHLKSHYPDWDKSKLVYRKWDFLNFG